MESTELRPLNTYCVQRGSNNLFASKSVAHGHTVHSMVVLRLERSLENVIPCVQSRKMLVILQIPLIVDSFFEHRSKIRTLSESILASDTATLVRNPSRWRNTHVGDAER